MDEKEKVIPLPGKTARRWNASPSARLVVTRTFNGPARLVFEAWTRPELFQRWWVTEIVSGLPAFPAKLDTRTGGTYRFVVRPSASAPQPMAFFGRYIEVIAAFAHRLDQ